MTPTTCRLRAAAPQDARLLWAWSQDPLVLAMAFDPVPVTWEAHARWFEERLLDGRSVMTVLERRDGTPVGQVRFDQVPAGWELDFSIAAPFRGQGYGHVLLRDALALARARWPEGTTLRARVLARNAASLALCRQVGFVPVEYGLEAGREYVAFQYAWGGATIDSVPSPPPRHAAS